MNDLLGGQFDIMCDQTTDTTNQIKEGKIKGYAVTTKFKVSSVPQLADARQRRHSGLRGIGLARHVGAEGFAQDVADKLVAALQAALKDQKVIERFASLGTEPCPRSRNSRCAQVTSCCRGEAMGRSHQGGRC